MNNENFTQQFLTSGSSTVLTEWIRCLRCTNQFELGVTIGEPYIDAFQHNEDFLLELSLCFYYAQKYKQSFECSVQILNISSSAEMRQRVLHNAHFCIPFIQNNRMLYPEYVVEAIGRRKTKIGLITFTITTCKRFDLFCRTMNSFLTCCEDLQLINRWICIDDNSDERSRRLMRDLYPFFEFIFKKKNAKGHAKSMNWLWQSVNTPFIFHLEDDWQFFWRRPYLTSCLRFLEQHDGYGQCLINQNYAETAGDINIKGGKRDVGYLTHEYVKDGEGCSYWPHFSLRAGMTRRSVLDKVGLFNENTGHFELEYAHRCATLGYKTAFLEGIWCVHIGRLTSERGGEKANAYVLNGEEQFAKKEREELDLKVFCINLDQRPDQLDVFDGQVDFSYERYSAIDGEKLVLTREIDQLFHGNDFNFRRGMVGCAISHVDLWCRLNKEENSDKVYLILEDDVEFEGGLVEKCEEITRELDGWDIIFLGHHSRNEERKSDGKIKVEKWDSVRSFNESLGGTGGYLISKRGARRMLDYIQKNGIVKGIDTMIQRACDSLDVYYLSPHLIYSECWRGSESNVDTDIQRDFRGLEKTDEQRLQDEIEFFEGLGMNVCEYPTSPDRLVINAVCIVPRCGCDGSRLAYDLGETYTVIVNGLKWSDYRLLKGGEYKVLV